MSTFFPGHWLVRARLRPLTQIIPSQSVTDRCTAASSAVAAEVEAARVQQVVDDTLQGKKNKKNKKNKGDLTC